MTRLAPIACIVLLAGCAASVPVMLSTLAAASCGAQAAANAAGAIAESEGSATWAIRFAEASKIAGLGCAW